MQLHLGTVDKSLLPTWPTTHHQESPACLNKYHVLKKKKKLENKKHLLEHSKNNMARLSESMVSSHYEPILRCRSENLQANLWLRLLHFQLYMLYERDGIVVLYAILSHKDCVQSKTEQM